MKRIALGSLILLLFALPANAWWTRGRAPACDSQEVISRIQSKFAYADRNTFHWGLQIRKVTEVYETPEVIQSASLIYRRYCRGTAWLSDGRSSEVYFIVESRQGFASYGFRVQSCLPEFDPWHTYDGWCRAAYP
jgi:hypothetical protein